MYELLHFNTHIIYGPYYTILRISQAVQVTDNSESSITMVTSKRDYVIRKGPGEKFMRPMQETNPLASTELVL